MFFNPDFKERTSSKVSLLLLYFAVFNLISVIILVTT